MTPSGRVVIAALLVTSLALGIPPWHYATAVMVAAIVNRRGRWGEAAW